MKQKSNWEVGSVFYIPTPSGDYAYVSQVVGREPSVLNSASIAIFDEKVASDTLTKQPELAGRRAVSVQFVTRDRLDSGEWPVVGKSPVHTTVDMLPYEHLRKSGFVGAKVIGSGIINKFIGALASETAWDLYTANPDYFDRLLISPDFRPAQPKYKSESVT